MQYKKLLLAGAVAATGAVGCGVTPGKQPEAQTTEGPTVYLSRANMDTTIKPGDDFFLYANGTWVRNTAIPGDKTRWGSFDELRDKTNKSVHTLLDDVAKEEAAPGTLQFNVAAFYKSGMDTAAIDKAGVTVLKQQLDAIKAISSPQQLLDVIIENGKNGLQTVLPHFIGPDDKNVNQNIIQFMQGGLGLPSKDYYTDKDANAEKNRLAYKNYIAKILSLGGQDTAAAGKDAAAIFELENRLAAASLYPKEMRDPQRMYNKFSLEAFTKQTPNLPWKTVFEKIGINGQDTLLVNVPQYYKAVSAQLTATPLDVWKAYLTYNLLSDMAPYLGKDFEEARFDFYKKTLSGQKQPEPRWERVMQVINNAIGEQLGKLYVDRYFKPEAKAKMMELVQNLQDAFSSRIKNLDWMSDVTKQKAEAKLAAFMKKIGYPDKWKDYSGLEIASGNYAQNVMNAAAFEYKRNLSKLGKPVDRTEWGMTPNTVNAYYNPAFNEIVFPAAILQFPFFDFGADDAVNYGGIGAVIGHEMTHGFDDQGAQYAADGNLKNWWTPEDAVKFKAKTKMVEAQFNGYTVLDSIHVNGALTLGENIADLGGITIAYDAFKKTKQGQGNELIDGFTPDQRFFLSWAQVWRGKSTPERARQLIKIDPHSPAEWRANGPLTNFEPWYKAFNVQPGNKMYKPENERAKIW
ncbi:M13 family metallopeptidase [Niabella beijingensis]|uniref:M13 family metallopeptidase n=1 Tax=Niabella beijingensis TaxID=2872700 RepID=UPI001CBE5A19|nr:M13 family metallopeptidase [Niabella beijingensis]MBZ4187940.1 M13 family metallopeptidase [Niabella beijingensis]